MLSSHSKHRESEEKRLQKRCKDARKDLVSRLQEMTKPRKVEDDGWHISVLKQEIPVEIQAEHADTGTYSYRLNGKIRCKVGTYGRQKQFPERKNYQSWIDAIASYLVDEAKQKAAMHTARANQAAAKKKVKGTMRKLMELGDAAQFDVDPIMRGACTVEKDGEYIPSKPEAITHVRVRADRYFSLDLPFDKAEEFLKDMKALRDKYSDIDEDADEE
jgi:hypothetical protein